MFLQTCWILEITGKAIRTPYQSFLKREIEYTVFLGHTIMDFDSGSQINGCLMDWVVFLAFVLKEGGVM